MILISKQSHTLIKTPKIINKHVSQTTPTADNLKPTVNTPSYANKRHHRLLQTSLTVNIKSFGVHVLEGHQLSPEHYGMFLKRSTKSVLWQRDSRPRWWWCQNQLSLPQADSRMRSYTNAGVRITEDYGNGSNHIVTELTYDLLSFRKHYVVNLNSVLKWSRICMQAFFLSFFLFLIVKDLNKQMYWTFWCHMYWY